MTLRTLCYGNYGIFLIMGDAGFISSTVRRLLGWRAKGYFFHSSLYAHTDLLLEAHLAAREPYSPKAAHPLNPRV